IRVANALVVVTLSACVSAIDAEAQPTPTPRVQPVRGSVALSLDEAVQRGIGKGEEVQLAQAEIDAAETRIVAARAAALPQIDATASYSRTYASAFQAGLDFRLSPEDRFTPDSTAPLEQRVRYLEDNAGKAVLTTLADVISTSLQGV